MAEALAVIGLASAIVQFVDFGTKLLNRLHEFGDDVGNMPKVFQDTKTRLPLIINTLLRTKEQAEAGGTVTKQVASALHPLIDGCTQQIELLYDIVDRNLPSPKASNWERRVKALKSMAVDKDVQRITASLDRNIQALIFYQTTASLDSVTLDTKASPSETYWVMPFLQNPKFVGRSSVIQELEAKLGQDVKGGRRLALAGLGGVGKSQVAVEMAYRTRERCPNCSVFWVPATSPEAFEAAYLEIGRQLNISGLTDPAANVKELVKARLSDGASIGKWFMVVDNADDQNMLFKNIGSEKQHATLMDYLPRTSHGDILFTTRNRKLAVKLAGANVVTISEMDEDAAEKLLRKSIIDTDSLNDDSSEITRTFLRQLTYLPLAIVQAAAYINENTISVEDYLNMLLDTEETAVELLSEDYEDEGRYRESKNPVATTWQISFEQIRSRDPLAARYLSFMACFDPKNIPLRLLPTTEISRKKQIEAFGTLKAYSFLTPRSDNETFDLHRLVHIATRNWLVMENSLADYTQQATERLAEEFPTSKHEEKAIWTALMPHAQYILASSFAQESKERYELVHRVSLCLSADGKYEEATRLRSMALTWTEQTLGMVNQETGIQVQLLAKLMQSMGKYDEAVALNMRAMGILSDRTSVSTTLNNLAMNYQSLGRLSEAQELFRRVVDESKLQLGEEHAETLKSIGNLATNYTTLGDWTQAEEMLLKAIEVSKRINGPEHPETLLYMNNLSVTYNSQRKLDQAEAMAKQTLELRTKVLGRDHPDTLLTINNLALSYINQERIGEAETLFQEVIRVSTKLQGKDHPDTLIARSNLASIYLAKSDWKKAEEQFAQVLETRKSFLGRYHMKTINVAARLGFVYHESGQTDKAEQLRMEVEEATPVLMMQGISPAWVTFRKTNDPAGFWEVVRKLCSPEARKHGIKVFTG